MKLVSYEIQTLLGRFERIGALAHSTIIDLTSAHLALLAESLDVNAARRKAEAEIPPDMIGFLEGGKESRQAADNAVAYVGEQLKADRRPLGPRGLAVAEDYGQDDVLAVALHGDLHRLAGGVVLHVREEGRARGFRRQGVEVEVVDLDELVIGLHFRIIGGAAGDDFVDRQL